MAESENFLIIEYQKCFEHLRYYDDRSLLLMRYLFTLTTSVATALFAIYKLKQTCDAQYYLLQSFMSLIVLIAILLLFLSMIQNRLYFVFIARQLNSIRKYFTEKHHPDFDNQLYTTTNCPAFKLTSAHTFQIFGAATLCGLYAGLTIFSINKYFDFESGALVLATITFVLFTLFIWGSGSIYLFIKGSKKSDDAIH